MIVLIIFLVVLVIVSTIVTRSFIEKKDQVIELENKLVFTNKTPRSAYGKLSAYLKAKKSKLSAQNKVEILNMWNAILLKLPDKYTDIVELNKEVIDNKDTLTKAEHKKELIEALDKLHDQDELDTLSLQRAVYHLYYLIFM